MTGSFEARSHFRVQFAHLLEATSRTQPDHTRRTPDSEYASLIQRHVKRPLIQLPIHCQGYPRNLLSHYVTKKL